ncbi:MAG: hypothetical protein ACXWXS_00850 [Actinomycetota bacterium]
MLFGSRFAVGIADGSITLAFRRWESRRAVPGARHRTPAGRIVIRSVTMVEPTTVTDMEADRAGYRSAVALLDDLRGEASTPIYRVEFALLDELDPRAVLAASDRLSDDDVADLARKRDRMDRVASAGPWTLAVLRAIDERPGTCAADLAEGFGRDPIPFKRDVRKLKELGLTESLEVGYRLSPRGRALLPRLADGGVA